MKLRINLVGNPVKVLEIPDKDFDSDTAELSDRAMNAIVAWATALGTGVKSWRLADDKDEVHYRLDPKTNIVVKISL